MIGVGSSLESWWWGHPFNKTIFIPYQFPQNLNNHGLPTGCSEQEWPPMREYEDQPSLAARSLCRVCSSCVHIVTPDTAPLTLIAMIIVPLSFRLELYQLAADLFYRILPFGQIVHDYQRWQWLPFTGSCLVSILGNKFGKRCPEWILSNLRGWSYLTLMLGAYFNLIVVATRGEWVITYFIHHSPVSHAF